MVTLNDVLKGYKTPTTAAEALNSEVWETPAGQAWIAQNAERLAKEMRDEKAASEKKKK